ncbi:MAG TPA: hypothetical protein VLF39_03660 [Candidatus Saccharimonadales bacterium]|nr:hypothetical protein [Candidatus Saccharimonadales bacterium]
MREILEENRHSLKMAAVFAGVMALGLAGARGLGELAERTYGANQAEHLLEDNGYKDPHILYTDNFLPSFNGCANGDWVKYEFEAVDPMGRDIKVAVCRGLLKESIIYPGK